jgi:hypothetical protein
METSPLSGHCIHEKFQMPLLEFLDDTYFHKRKVLFVGQNASVLIVLLCCVTGRHNVVTGS